jgi:hypothetical protein
MGTAHSDHARLCYSMAGFSLREEFSPKHRGIVRSGDRKVELDWEHVQPTCLYQECRRLAARRHRVGVGR